MQMQGVGRGSWRRLEKVGGGWRRLEENGGGWRRLEEVGGGGVEEWVWRRQRRRGGEEGDREVGEGRVGGGEAESGEAGIRGEEVRKVRWLDL